MSLIVWLPLNGDLRNQGLSNFIVEPIKAPTYVAGKIGKCYQRANSNSQLTDGLKINDNLVDLFGNQASIAVWVKPLGTHTHYNGTFISSGNWNTSRWTFGVSQDNTKVDVLCGGHNNYIDCAVPINEWTHLVSVFDNGTCKLYKNGVYVGEKTGQAAFQSDATWTGIGRETYAGGYFGFNGCLNDLRIYDHCLSEKEVKEIAKGLILHYKLDGFFGGAGENLVINGDARNGLTGWSNWGIASSRQVITINNKKWFTFKTDASGNYGGFSQDRGIALYKPNTQYTISALMYASANASGRLWVHTRSTEGGANLAQYLTTVNVTTSPALYTFTFNTGSNASYTINKLNLMIGAINTTSTLDFYISNIKVEEGTKATIWVPCKEEGDYDITKVEDSSGYNHNGQIVSSVNISSDTMRYNTSTLFDGVDDCIIVPYNTICPENIFTINLWFKKDALGSKNYETLFGGPRGFEMDTRAGASTALSLYMASTRGGNAATGLQLNTWYMVTMVRDGINERYYINSELKKEIEAKAMPTGVYRIGAWASNTGQNYYGNISDFRIYCTALSADDIKELYQTSASIDDKQNFYSRELSNSLHDTTSITQAGIALADDFVEDAVAAIKDDRSIESNCFYEY